MKPIRVRVDLRGQIVLHKPLALDALLAASIAKRDGLPPALTSSQITPIEIPVEREPSGRFHLCSFSIGRKEEHEKRWTNRRFPIQDAQALASTTLRRIAINGGPCKSYRIPLEAVHMEDDSLTWWLVGDQPEIEALLWSIRYLGKRRAVGYGPVVRWTVEPCEPWGDGFPVVRDGVALRHLPADWPGLVKPNLAIIPLSYPYDRRNVTKAICAVPTW